jgi:uncharacterized membrane protein
MLTKSDRPLITLNSPTLKHIMKTSVITYSIILGGAILWCGVLVLPPLLLSAGGAWGAVGIALYQSFHTICHQLTERSIYIFGAPLAVCMRCSAIYFGFLFGTILFVPLRLFSVAVSERRVLLIISILPLLADVVLDVLGVHASTGATRLITGLLFGVVVPFYIIPAAQEAAQELLAASRFFTPSDVKKGSIHA